MIIDTYVYFVSYRYKEIGNGLLGMGQSTIGLEFEIKTGDDVDELTKYLIDDNSCENVILINFQLLDSYNKEERDNKKESV
jgi:hypothetical protein